jgi:FkbM family methyltransferase
MFRRLVYGTRRILPRPLRRLAYRAGLFLGAEFRPVSSFGGMQYPSVWAALSQLRRRGFNPKLAVDIGAYRGEWTRMFKSLYSDCRVLMVEAQDRMAPHLGDVCASLSGVEYRIALLGRADEHTTEFFEMLSGSSVFPENSAAPRRKMKTISLDTLLEDTAPDLLKLDVQGYELEVLMGASRTLRHCEVALLETSLIPVNRGAPLAAEVISFMDTSGFRLVDFCSQIRLQDGALWQTDLLFISNSSGFLPASELGAHRH